jgi:hypothetical protein
VLLGACLAAGLATQPGSAGASPATQPGESRGRRIVFVCDASNSMISKLTVVRRELSNTLDGLRPIDKFAVIFMRAKGCAASDTELVPTTPANRDKCKAFIAAFKPGGKTDPIPAIDAAFAMRPQLIYLLGDGDFRDNNALLQRITELNKGQNVKVNPILVWDKIEPTVEQKKFFEAIATANGGVFLIRKLGDL